MKERMPGSVFLKVMSATSSSEDISALAHSSPRFLLGQRPRPSGGGLKKAGTKTGHSNDDRHSGRREGRERSEERGAARGRGRRMATGGRSRSSNRQTEAGPGLLPPSAPSPTPKVRRRSTSRPTVGRMESRTDADGE